MLVVTVLIVVFHVQVLAHSRTSVIVVEAVSTPLLVAPFYNRVALTRPPQDLRGEGVKVSTVRVQVLEKLLQGFFRKISKT